MPCPDFVQMAGIFLIAVIGGKGMVFKGMGCIT
jgi:hypothetical protein